VVHGTQEAARQHEGICKLDKLKITLKNRSIECISKNVLQTNTDPSVN